jgi:hypothetical protein
MPLHCIGQFESISRCTSTLSTTKQKTNRKEQKYPMVVIRMADCHVVVRGKVDRSKAEGRRLRVVLIACAWRNWRNILAHEFLAPIHVVYIRSYRSALWRKGKLAHR